MKLSEAEIQLLAMLHAAGLENRASSRAGLEACGQRYWHYLEDWSMAYASLLDRGLIGGDDSAYHLTAAGQGPAQDYYSERPDRYFYYYRDFYRRAYDSRAHSRLCEIAFGKDLTQEGQLDMEGVEDITRRLDLKPGQRLLDLGCGAGGIAEYLAESTGAIVTGVDYSATAVEVGNQRTRSKRDRVNFVQADLNAIELEAQAFDAAVMIDSIYWVADTVDGIRRILHGLKPGGQLLILIVQILQYCETPEELEIDGNFVASALDELKLDYGAFDCTEAFIPFWPRLKMALDELHEEFVDEGNEFIYQSLLEEAENEYLPAIEAGEARRYLYHVRL